MTTRRIDTFSACTLASGAPLALSRLAIDGRQTGPRVGISATIHGDEIEGLLILRELWRTIPSPELAGSLRLLPVANPLALETLTRNTPLDMLDLNRVFPGVPDGWLSEQLASAIAREFLDQIDVYIDLHAGGTFPLVDYCYALNDDGLSRAFLSELLYKPAQIHAGTTAAYTQSHGVPTTVVELGGGYLGQEEQVRRGVDGVLNMLRHLGLLPGTPERRPRQVLLHEIKVMRPRNGGLCVPAQRLMPGTWVDGSSKLADIISPYTFEPLEVMVAPFDRSVVVLARTYTTRVNPGDYAFMMGNGATASYYD